MMRPDREEDPLPEAKEFFDMLRDAEKPLHDGCELSVMSMATRIMDIKHKYNLPLKCVDDLVSLMKDFYPDSSKNMLTETFDATKKLIAGLELPHQKIDMCPDGCMLFWKGDALLERCSSCNASRYKMNSKGKPIPRKVLIYFPITPRLQRLYATTGMAEEMRWHSENPRANGSIAHPCDGEAWKKFDAIYPEFANEPRNVRLGLYIDEHSPFDKGGYNWAPVILTIYNLPPWLCMKRPFMFWTLIIPGSNSPIESLDLCLRPLIEELKQLWSVGATTYDISKKQNFNMRAAVMWTICDFPTYTLLSGHSPYNMWGCPYPYCMETARSSTPKNSCKQRTGYKSMNCVQSLSNSTTDQSNTREMHGMHIWTEQSIFWELPYWSKLLIRHNLDVKYIEKIVLEQLFRNMMLVKEQTKDSISIKRDLDRLCNHVNQQPRAIDAGEEITGLMQKAPYVLNKEQRKALCEWIKKLKFPSGYASNLSQCVDLQEYKLFGMNNHDCHVFLERLLPVAFKELLPADVWTVMAKISQFFRKISSPLLQTKDMVRLENSISKLLRKLEKIYPLPLFNVMEHLPIHLPYEANVGGPIRYRSIYPFQRFLHHLKAKMSSKGRMEDSICRAYLTEEISNFCGNYVEPLIDTKTEDMGRNVGMGVHELMDENLLAPFAFTVEHATNRETRLLDEQEYRDAHKCVLAECELLREYERLFEEEIRRRHPRVRGPDVWKMFEHQFSDWLKQYVLNSDISDDIIRTLAMGPSRFVQKMDKCSINGFNFHTYAYGKNKSSRNYGAFATGSDHVEHYGIIQEMIELLYAGATTSYRTVLFKCDWMDSGMGLNIHEDYKLVEVNHAMERQRYEPFVLACRVQQVYFTPYPSIKNDRSQWWAIFKIKGSSIFRVLEDDRLFQQEMNENPLSLSEAEEDEDGSLSETEDDEYGDDQDEEDGDDQDGEERDEEYEDDQDEEEQYEVDGDDQEKEDENEYDEPEQEHEDEAQERELEVESQQRYSLRKRPRK